MSIRLKLVITYLAAALIPLLFLSVITFHNYRDSLQELRLAQLRDITQVNVDKFENYFSGLRTDLEIARSFYSIRKNLPALNASYRSPSGPAFLAAKSELDGQLRPMQAGKGLADIMLAGPGGKVLYASDPGHFRKELLNALPDPKVFTEGKRKLYTSDVFFDKALGGRPAILLAAPALDLNKTFCGIIIFELDMAPLYALARNQTGLGSTGELLLGKKDGGQALFLNPLKYDPGAALKRRVPLGSTQGEPIQKAVQGGSGSGISVDYRGREVIAAWRYLPTMGWGIVAKLDTAEAFAPIAELRKLLAMMLSLIILLGGVSSLAIAESISTPIKKLSEGAVRIGGGDLDYKVGTSQQDEIGKLSRTFDEMTANLKNTTASRETLRLSEERYRGLFTSMLEGFCVIEVVFDAGNKPVDYRFLELNPAFENQTGLHNAQGRLMRELAPDHEKHWFESYGRVALTGEPARFVNEAKALDRWFDVSAFRLGGPESRKVAILFSDISELKRTELERERILAELRVNEQRVSMALQSGHGGAWDWDLVTGKAWWSPEMYGLWGVEPGTPRGTENSFALIDPRDRDRVKAAIDACVKDHTAPQYEFRILHPRLGERWMATFSRIIYGVGGAAVRATGITMDVTERRRIEEKVKTLAAIVATSKDAVIGKDLDGTIRSWNKGAADLYGYTSAEVIGKPISLLLPPGREDEIPGILKRIARGESIGHFETIRARKDGRLVQVSLAVSPIMDQNGVITGVSTIARDITESKKLEEELKRSNENLEQFAYVASHDLQEPLRMMASYSELLERRYKDKLDADANEFIGYIVDGAKRQQKLINDLLAYSRVGRTDKAEGEVDCNSVLDRVLGGMRTAIEETGAVVTRGQLPVLTGNESNFVQLFQNLVGNGIKFHGATPPRIQVKAVKQGGNWLFTVEDNGIGLEAQYKDRIFVIFQRLHGRGAYPGTGIGLAICKKIVETRGGRIWVESEPGRGSVFNFTIPEVRS